MRDRMLWLWCLTSTAWTARRRDERGIVAAEYIVIAAVLLVVIIAGATALSGAMREKIGDVIDTIRGA